MFTSSKCNGVLCFGDDSGVAVKRLRLSFIGLAVALGLFQAWAYRFEIYMMDGITYLDMSDYFCRGDWSNAINSYWSPLYPLFAAAVFQVLRPSPQWEYFALKVANFLCYLLVLGSFELFLKVTLVYYKQLMSDESRKQYLRLPEFWFRAAIYAVFLWCFLTLGGVYQDTPDLLTAALVLLASTSLILIKLAPGSLVNYVLLGLALGLGYLSKAVMFPLSFAYILIAAVLGRTQRNPWKGPLLAGLVFLFVSGPLLILLSARAGAFTYSGAGSINYLWFVSTKMLYMHGVGEPGLRESLKHPSRMILEDPLIFEFGSPVAGTFPPWYDPAYWHEGVTVVPDLMSSLGVLLLNVYAYGTIFLGYMALWWFVLVVWSRQRTFSRTSLKENYFLFAPPAVALILYSLAANLFIASYTVRYFPPFIVLMVAGFLCSIRLADNRRSSQAVLSMVALVGVVAIIQLTNQLALDIRAARQENIWWQVASELRELGIRPQDKVACFRDEERYEWARAARLKIVAQVFSPEEFWRKDEKLRTQALEAMAKAGARAVILFPAPMTVLSEHVNKHQQKRVSEIKAALSFLGLSTADIKIERWHLPASMGKRWRKLPGLDCYVYLLR